MPGLLTEITEITTALGMLGGDLTRAMDRRPAALQNVPDPVWNRLVESYLAGEHAESFGTAFANGTAFLAAAGGLRGRPPHLIEWRGPHRPPGDDSIPADLRIDHVYLVSCKYLSKVLVNTGPARLFDRLLSGEQRTGESWFSATAPDEYLRFYTAARAVAEVAGAADLPKDPKTLSPEQQQRLRGALAERVLPEELQPEWAMLCSRVAEASAHRWCTALATPRKRLYLLWRLLRVSNATYFVLGTDRAAYLRLRVGSTWDWNHGFDLREFTVAPRPAGQPEVSWRALVKTRASGITHDVAGHVEIRWSHGRFVGTPEAKVYLDSPYASIPGYEPINGNAVAHGGASAPPEQMSFLEAPGLPAE